MKQIKRVLLFVSLFALLLTSSACSNQAESELDPNNPVTITLWNYYNGAQFESFNALVDEFNETVGKDKGIIVEAYSQGTVNDLETNVLDAINGKVGASDVPNIFSAYSDTAYMVDQLGYAQDISSYFSEEELSEYVDSYIEEGMFQDALKIFPIAKSTEILMMNKTDWETFSETCDVEEADLATFEGITKTAELYYEWTDSLTPEVANDGKSFFGRDAIANYFITGLKQHGIDLFTVDEEGNATLHFDKEVVRKLWDNFYVPFVKGYFASTGRFRSDDIKTGNILAYIGSSSSATFFPKQVYVNDEESYDIDSMVLEVPHFEGFDNVVIQQGAGMVVTKASEQEVQASVVFLKWFTQEEQNIKFSIESGYLPVIKSANSVEAIKEYTNKDSVGEVLEVSIATINDATTYTTKSVNNGVTARSLLEHHLLDKAKADRESVLASIASGTSYEEAIARYDNDDNFDAWYSDIYAQLEELIQ